MKAETTTNNSEVIDAIESLSLIGLINPTIKEIKLFLSGKNKTVKELNQRLALSGQSHIH